MRRFIAAIGVGLSTVLLGCGGGGGGGDGVPRAASDSSDVKLTLLWDPNPEREHVQGYLVFFGFEPDATSQLLSTLLIGSAGFDAAAPSVSYQAASQLGVRAGDTACFRVKAFNEVAQSEFSNAACKTL